MGLLAKLCSSPSFIAIMGPTSFSLLVANRPIISRLFRCWHLNKLHIIIELANQNENKIKRKRSMRNSDLFVRSFRISSTSHVQLYIINCTSIVAPIIICEANINSQMVE